jgi:iron complex outermembrane receptor protein
MNPRGVRECCALLAFASPAAVLAEAGEAEPQRLDKVEIVGSHLTRSVDHEGPTPISIYRRDDIEASGAMRLSDFLLALRIASAGGFDDRGTGFNFHTGAAALSLRGLGPGATLVLLNGRRIAAYGLVLDNDDTFVDLNAPLALAAPARRAH